MNVAIARKSDENFTRGEINDILYMDNNMITIENKVGNRIRISVYDDDFLILLSASKSEVQWIANNFF